ncbi:MAG TPA: fatty acyl-AMP ligase, partial [Thermoanaerobaculia bacterium]|nr:fatty acyl-AMP ligase [Thermoanaerobaculia bacterium]
MFDVLRQRAGESPEREVFTWLDDAGAVGARLTWGELDERARAVAAALAQRVPAGERALLLFPPGLDFVVAFCGCLYAGVVAVPAYPPRGERSLPRLDAIAGDCRPAAVLTTAALADRVSGWIAGGGPGSAATLLTIDDLGADAAAAWRRPAVGPDTLAFLQYTSGSTGVPKGVCVTHRNLLHNEETIRRAFGQSADSVVVSWLPLYHDMGLIGGVLQPLYVGARCVLSSPAGFLRRPVSWLEAIARHGGTTSGGPNFAYELAARKVSDEEREGLDLSSWRVAFNGAEPVRPETLDRFARAFAGCGFRRSVLFPCYGLAEATLFVSGGAVGEGPAVGRFDAAALATHRARPAADGRPLAASGRPSAGQRVAIVDGEGGRELPAGEVGEIWVSGPSVAGGYWGRPEETERVFAARLAGGEGPFLRTGDLGFLAPAAAGEEPQLFVTGRVKDLVILRGRNVYPQDVEATVEAAHPALEAGGAAAFGVDDGGEERLVVACEVRRSVRRSGDELWDEVGAAVRQAVFEEHEAALHDLVLLRPGALPRTTSGKVRR